MDHVAALIDVLDSEERAIVVPALMERSFANRKSNRTAVSDK